MPPSTHSTLVDILAGKRKAGRTFGSVQLLTSNARAVRIGYVDQADVLPANLSGSCHTYTTYRAARLTCTIFQLFASVSCSPHA